MTAGRLMAEHGSPLWLVDLDLVRTRLREFGDVWTLPGTLWSWPRIEAAGMSTPPTRPIGPALVSGPLCLNVDVLHPAAPLPLLEPGDALLMRAAGAYHQAQSTRFGDLRPAVLAREDGRWRVCLRRETLDDLLARDIDMALAGAAAPAGTEEGHL